MRASRLIQLLLLLQTRREAPARVLARELEVSTRTIYRDVEALAAAGVPIYTEPGRNGGIRLLPGYRPAGLPQLDDTEARGIALGALPDAAQQLGLAPAAGEAKLFASMEPGGEAAARAVRERLLVEPEPWWTPTDDTPWLATVATAVWDDRQLRLTYHSPRHDTAETKAVEPLGLVLKAGTWYLLGLDRRTRHERMYRVSRIRHADILDHRFERPADFDLAAAWSSLKRAFIAAIPTYHATVRVSADATELLHLLEEGTPRHLPSRDEADADGWLTLTLRFEDPATAERHLLRLGTHIEVLDPPELRHRIATTAHQLHDLYSRTPPTQP